MQTTIDREKRREYRQNILNNITAIVTAVDDIDKAAAGARNHLHLHDRFFFQHASNLQEDESYGNDDDLVDLYQDTVQVLRRLERARIHMSHVCTLMQYYDYSSNAIFGEFAAQEAEQL